MKYSCVVPLLLFVLCLAGCRSSDLVETELRTRERELRETREAVTRLEFHNAALQRELCTLHQGASNIPPEWLSQVSSVRRIVLGRQTGGYDDHQRPGDEALQVVIEPRDGEDQRIKAPGTVHIEALEISPEGLKTPLSSWDLSPEQLRRTWREGLFNTGYYVLLPWKVWPSNPSLRVVARFTLPDGRVFEADRDVKVRLAPQAGAHNLPGLPGGPMLAEPDTALPPPRSLESLPPPALPGPTGPVAPPPPRPLGPVPPPGNLESAAGWQPDTPDNSVSLRRPLPLLSDR